MFAKILIKYKHWRNSRRPDPGLPDWLTIMNKLYESPNDWMSDNKLVDEYTCRQCGAPFQRKMICEYCGSRKDKSEI